MSIGKDILYRSVRYAGNIAVQKVVSSSCKLIDGKGLAKTLRKELKLKVNDWVGKGHRPPHLAAFLVGDDPASHSYVNIKEKAAKRVGIDVSVLKFSHQTSEEFLLKSIHELNEDKTVDGILVQLPLPRGINERRVCNAVSPYKDVDGFSSASIGRLALNIDSMVPCTALAVLHLLMSTGIPLRGKTAVVCGRSKNVGLPISLMLHSQHSGEWSGLDMTTSICHRHTPRDELRRLTSIADVIVSAAGVPRLITGDMVKPGACIIDVGLTRVPSDNGSTTFVGDVDFDGVSEVAGHLTPVPGGVGPVTVAMLLSNTLKAATTSRYTPKPSISPC